MNADADKETLIRVYLRSSAANDLENQLQRKLTLPRRIARADGPEGGTGRLRVRYSEIRVVQNIEELRPELHPGLISNPEVLVHGKIPLVEVRSAERIPADIPVRLRAFLPRALSRIQVGSGRRPHRPR